MEAAIIGGGASGLACAVALRQKSAASVTVYERLEQVLKKLPATGNGRCNLTNLNAAPRSYYEAAPFVGPALTRYGPERNMEFFGFLGLPCFVGEEGRAYPLSRSARSVVTVLENAARRLGVKIRTGTQITLLQKTKDGFLLNGLYRADRVVLACGGSAAPEHGTDGTAFALFRQTGHRVTPLSPALTGLRIRKLPHSLKGVRQICRAELLIKRQSVFAETGEVQFADGGVSGIPVMQLSRFVTAQTLHDAALRLDLLPSLSEDKLLSCLKNQPSGASAEETLSRLFPVRLGNYCLLRCGIRKDRDYGSLPAAELDRLAAEIKNMLLPVEALRDFRCAQVTRGGAALGDFIPETLESRLVRGLYAAGEALDVDGPCGGYNLQWAWSSARLAAEAISKG